MRTKSSAALYGKPRHTHHRSKTARSAARQAIDDYWEPAPECGYIRVERAIPIRARNEFLPSAADHVASRDAETGSQLELAFRAGGVDSQLISTSGAPHGTPRPIESDVSSTTPSRRKKGFHQVGDEGYTLGGFVYGCALGGAAAAGLLLVVQLAGL